MKYDSEIVKVTSALLVCIWLFSATLMSGANPQHSLEELNAMRRTDPVALLQILDQELAAVDDGADMLTLAHLHRLRSQTLRDRGEYDSAREDAIAFEEKARALNDSVLLSRAIMLHGTIDAEQNQLTNALDKFHEARRILEDSIQGTELDRARELSMVNTAIGVTHNFAFDFERAHHYYEEALRLARLAEDEVLVMSALGNLALAVSEIDGPEAGLPMHREALELSQQHGDLHGEALQRALICERLLEIGRLDEARSTCLVALDQVSDLGLTRPLASTRMTLGRISRERGELSEAVGFFELALDDAVGVVPGVVLELHKELSEVYEAMGKPERAMHHMRSLVTLRDEARESERQELIEELEVKYEVEQHERQLERMRLDAQLSEVQLRQRTHLLLATAIGLAFACLGALAAWRGYRVKAGLERTLDVRNQDLERAVEEIGRLARTDSLTGLLNRRAFDEQAADQMARARRNGQPLTIVLADIDQFKDLNDGLGHQAGDETLKWTSNQISKFLRGTDLVCRWGGEEFLCLLDDSDTGKARSAIERLRSHLADQVFQVEGTSISVTLTYGIAPLLDDLDVAIREADAAMYEGKRRGRDRIVLAGEIGPDGSET